MEKTGIYDYQAEVYALDFRRQLTIPALSNYLLYAATCHAASRGYGFDDMAKQNMLWVLSRLIIDIKDNKRLSGPIRILTWIEGVDRILTYRCFEITTREGETLAFARSSWAGINHDTRRPVMLDNLGLEDYFVNRPCPIPFDKFEIPAEDPEYTVPYTVRYSDLDMNGHFNSVKYMEAILDMFDIELYRTRTVTRFDIMYLSEGFYGMELTVKRNKINENEYVASICKESKPICRANVRFRGM